MINIYKCFEINLKTVIVDAKGRLQKKRENVGILKKQGGGLPESHFHFFLLFLTWETSQK